MNALTRTIGYDCDNHVTSISENGNSSTFAYDYAGARVMKTETFNNVATTTYYFGAKYEEQYTSGQPAKFISYYFANGQRVAQRTDSGTTSEVLWISTDHLGSSVRFTDSFGNPVQSIAYDPFGKTVFYSGTKDPKYQYTGQEFDSASGLLFYGARYYDPEIGRFLQADTMLDGINRYAYCWNNPMRYVDPTGTGGQNPDGTYDYSGAKNPHEGEKPSTEPSSGPGPTPVATPTATINNGKGNNPGGNNGKGDSNVGIVPPPPPYEQHGAHPDTWGGDKSTTRGGEVIGSTGGGPGGGSGGKGGGLPTYQTWKAEVAGVSLTAYRGIVIEPVSAGIGLCNVTFVNTKTGDYCRAEYMYSIHDDNSFNLGIDVTLDLLEISIMYQQFEEETDFETVIGSFRGLCHNNAVSVPVGFLSLTGTYSRGEQYWAGGTFGLGFGLGGGYFSYTSNFTLLHALEEHKF